MPCSVQQTRSHKSHVKPYGQPPFCKSLIFKTDTQHFFLYVGVEGPGFRYLCQFASAWWLHIVMKIMCGIKPADHTQDVAHAQTRDLARSYIAVDLVLRCVDWCLAHVCQTHKYTRTHTHTFFTLSTPTGTCSALPENTHLQNLWEHTQTHWAFLLPPQLSTAFVYGFGVQMCLFKICVLS